MSLLFSSRSKLSAVTKLLPPPSSTPISSNQPDSRGFGIAFLMWMWEASRFSCEEALFFLGVVIIGLSDFDLFVRGGRWWSLQRWSSSSNRDDDQCGESREGGRNDQMKPTAASPSKEPIRLCQDMFTKVNIQTTCETRVKASQRIIKIVTACISWPNHPE